MRHKRALAALAALLLAVGIWSFWLEPDSLQVNEYDLPLLHCPPELVGLRIALISDLHAGAPWIDLAKLKRVVQLTNAAHPELVLLAGDFVAQNVLAGSPMPPDQFAPVLGELRAPLGVYAVLGNHDTGYGRKPIARALAAAGIRPMDNRAWPIGRNASTFWLAGLAEFNLRPRHVVATLQQVPPGAPLILFAHQPFMFDFLPPGVDLMLAGHTHGGQINLPLLTRLAISPAIFKYLSGHFRQQTDLFVTRGIGTSVIPARLRAPPEIALLTLRPES